jgi:hypothetical protein
VKDAELILKPILAIRIEDFVVTIAAFNGFLLSSNIRIVLIGRAAEIDSIEELHGDLLDVQRLSVTSTHAKFVRKLSMILERTQTLLTSKLMPIFLLRNLIKQMILKT